MPSHTCVIHVYPADREYMDKVYSVTKFPTQADRFQAFVKDFKALDELLNGPQPGEFSEVANAN